MNTRDSWDLVASETFERALSANLRALRPYLPPPIGVQAEPRDYLQCIGECHGSHFVSARSQNLPGTGSLLLRRKNGLGDLLLDPGWGTLAAARRLGVDLSGVATILVSHNHLDHVGDLQALLLQLDQLGRRPLLIANTTTVNGTPHHPSPLPTFFRRLCEDIVVARAQESLDVDGVSILPFATAHREGPHVVGDAMGYVVDLQASQGVKVGLVTDGPLTDHAWAYLQECQVIAVNVGTMSALPGCDTHDRIFDNSLSLSGLAKLLDDLGPTASITDLALTHLGAEILELAAPGMQRIMQDAGTDSLVDLLKAAVISRAHSAFGRQIGVRVLREGMTVPLGPTQ